jgi:hypothetical protein
MSLLLDSNVDALGAVLEMPAPGRPAYFQWHFESTGSAGVSLALSVSLALEQARDVDLQLLNIGSVKHVVTGNTTDFYSSTALDFSGSNINAKGMFYLDNVPRIVVPRLYAGYGTWRVRLWGWA